MKIFYKIPFPPSLYLRDFKKYQKILENEFSGMRNIEDPTEGVLGIV
jgi:hypothetical protein